MKPSNSTYKPAEILEKLGLRAASTDNYFNWIKSHRWNIMGDPSKEKSAC